MDIIVAYDVDTTDKAGQRRLRRVALTCQDFGQRVQYSLFECRVSEAQLEVLIQRLLGEIDADKDSLRIYILHLGRDKSLRQFGKDRYRDFEDPLII